MRQRWLLAVILAIFLVSGILVGKGISPRQKPVKTQKPPEVEEMNKANLPVRSPAVAGQFYPADKNKLQNDIDKYLNNARPPRIKGELVALITPHAGYIYSAGTAAYAFKLLEGKKIDTVILVGGSHITNSGVASIYDQGFFRTPLGDAEIDSELARKILCYSPELDNNTQPHVREHCLEVEVPFLQTVVPEAKIVPIIIKRPTFENAKLVAQAIVWAMNSTEKSVLLVGSTDMSHYFPRETAAIMDRLAIKDIENMNSAQLYQDLLQRKTQLCGQAAVIATMLVARSVGAENVTELHYSDSGDASRDTKSVVGYVAMAFSAYKPLPKEVKKTSQLDEKAQKRLIEIARATAIAYIKDRKVPKITNDIPVLNEKWGAFVTINKNKQLRGCIGRFTPVDKALYLIVQDMAVAASSQDPRFPPISPSETDDLEFEISVLSPMKRIKDVNEIEVGKHGIYIIKGFYRGVLLPQVATEYGWDRMTFLKQTCRKAGLPSEAWREPDTEIYTFTAQIIHETRQ